MNEHLTDKWHWQISRLILNCPSPQKMTRQKDTDRFQGWRLILLHQTKKELAMDWQNIWQYNGCRKDFVLHICVTFELATRTWMGYAELLQKWAKVWNGIHHKGQCPLNKSCWTESGHIIFCLIVPFHLWEAQHSYMCCIFIEAWPNLKNLQVYTRVRALFFFLSLNYFLSENLIY